MQREFLPRRRTRRRRRKRSPRSPRKARRGRKTKTNLPEADQVQDPAAEAAAAAAAAATAVAVAAAAVLLGITRRDGRVLFPPQRARSRTFLQCRMDPLRRMKRLHYQSKFYPIFFFFFFGSTVYDPSLELGLFHPLSFASECTPPPDPNGCGGTLACGRGGGVVTISTTAEKT